MRILVVGTIQGDNGYEEEFLVRSIEKYLKDNGHIVDSFMLPYARDMLSLPDQIAAYQMFDLSNSDLLITVGYPACMLSHDNKIIYLMETSPMLNEYVDSEYGIQVNPQYSKLIEAVKFCEETVFKTAANVFCNSKLLQNDIVKNYAIDANTLYYPNIFKVEDSEKDITEPYFVSETSLLPYHRVDLLLDTIKEDLNNILYLYVPRYNSVYYETLIKQIEERNLSGNVYVKKGIMPDNILKNAQAFISTDYQVRKIPGGIIRSASLGISILACDDSGAIEEYINVHKCGICEKANAKLLAKKLKCIPTNRSLFEKPSMDITRNFMKGLTKL